jgi:hypothetical protein
MLIAILNQSSGPIGVTGVTDADVATMTAAIATQIQVDVAPAWDRAPATVTFYNKASDVPAGAFGVAIVNTIDDQPSGVLGVHTADWGLVATQPEFANGAQVLTGDWSVSSTLSHEVLEIFVDPACNLWADNGQGKAYSLEVCDPVEAPTYTVSGVSVSNFVTPSWFDPLAPSGAQFDKRGQVTAPFTMAAGGYVTYAKAGHVQQDWGTTYPGWRQTMKEGQTGGRGHRRLLASWHT